MPPKRKRRASVTTKGLAPGEKLKRSALPGNTSSPWAWVGTEVSRPSDITSEHLLLACNLSERNNLPFCPNKYALVLETIAKPTEATQVPEADRELEDDVIVISDDEQPSCNPKACKANPNCLNYLGQDGWEDENEATETFLKAVPFHDSPTLDAREPDLPVGLKNLGATCYANASLQVWFRDLAFRTGVYKCQPADRNFKESPIFQLQVTFAALQESTQSVFNPTKLVESLQLRTTEQQDAQEFSKLFMSHLDAEFQKQAIPEVKSLVTDQFQGKQVYGTICNHCQYRSERTSDFLEIEINLENNSKLEDRIAAVLQPETLSGDNKYFCSQCDSLQDATRYTELRELPPVLHFSLLRFVYDISTMERKKSKHVVSFPTILDMNCFVGSADRPVTANTCDGNLYELRGILLHKGSSAYHGHYEAQVYDSTISSWFQCNDENVTRIKTLGEKLKTGPTAIDVEDDSDQKPSNSQKKKKRANNRKRRRIESDDEAVPVSSPADTQDSTVNKSEIISSKDAYMLIYARKKSAALCHSSAWEDVNTAIPIPVPPPSALEVVEILNATHDKACELHNENEKSAKAHFRDRRKKVMEIYRMWNVPSNEDSVLVSRQALIKWLSQYENESIIALPDGGEINERESTDEGVSETIVPLNEILCVHRLLDPKTANSIKRINNEAYMRIIKDTGWKFEPRLTDSDVCGACVKSIFQERLYQIQHPRLVSRFEQISDVALDCQGFWISKPWVKDWRLVKPKMHIPSVGDPPPDSSDFQSHVFCEHQGLSLNTTSRRKISVEATELLQTLYPDWRPLPTNSELCSVCDALVHISQASKREVRKQAEEEKARLKHMYDNALSGDTLMLEDVPCALIPTAFVKKWKLWLHRPTEAPRPDSVDNLPFICEHDMLLLDPNSSTDLDSFVVIKRSDWDILEAIYPSGPLIAIKRSQQGEVYSYIHDIPVCADCCFKRMSDWTVASITIRLTRTKEDSEKTPKATGRLTYSKIGARQSKRLRQMKAFGEKRRLTISKSTTVKEIKVMVQEELDIPTICQRLFYRGQELDDNEATVSSLSIFANDILDLQQENETLEIDSDTGEKRPRTEERGFGGTLLGQSMDRISSSPSLDVSHLERPCPACTFSNGGDALTCTICGTQLT